MTNIDFIIFAVYFFVLMSIGVLGVMKAKSSKKYMLADSNLGVFMLFGCLTAVFLGGSSTIGSSQLGYEIGFSGFWFVFALGAGITIFGLLFLSRILNMEVITINELLYKLFGSKVRIIGAIVTAIYTLMISVTQVIAIGSLVSVIFHWDMETAILVGGSVVFIYTILGGMWTLSITDFIQFSVMTIGMFFIMLPVSVHSVGGFGELFSSLPSSHLSFTNIGINEIFNYFITYTLGVMVGQDIWQRFFTGKTKRVAKTSGVLVGIYSALYSIIMVIIGMCAYVLFPNIQNTQNVFTHMAFETLQPGLLGIVFAALAAAIMSTASGTLLASSTIISNDILKPFFFKNINDEKFLLLTRLTTLCLAIIAIVIAISIKEVLVAIDIAYAILTGAIFMPVILGLFITWITERAAFLAILVSIITVFLSLIIVGPSSNVTIIYAIALNTITLLGVSYYDNNLAKEKNNF
ncbi:sodium:solute symporter [Staphylococcus equorum]|uniref:Sodium:solute symporter n=1 Tax=Staphylococcus equorum TaxID=246432 RepID=A0A9X4LDK9_9STAP|nr:sodium:solute symporter [Staphylococcus equorum]MDG0844410.1 sodium:solute symporter [Staphylococcus equorum]MDG0860597.1 sodium:solute symporter [Staphylococcus equorum]